MAINEKLAALVGQWNGTNKLNLSWTPDPIRESSSNAVATMRVGATCLEIEYDWEFEDKRQEGLILIASGDPGQVHAVWTDSWHSANVLMNCDGTASEAGSIDLKGYYKVEGHADWGWRTEIIPSGESFRYLMYNVTPEGVEEWAVEMEFTRT